MSNIMAAIGNVQLERFDELYAKRKKLVKRYLNNLKNFADINLLKIKYDEIFMHIFPVILPQRVDRVKLRERLNLLGIATGVHYYPNHYLTLYKKNITLKNTEKIYSQILTLPLHFDLQLYEVDIITDNLKKFIED